MQRILMKIHHFNLAYKILYIKGNNKNIFHKKEKQKTTCGCEARQTSKEQTKRPRCMLEGPRPCTSFVLHSYTMHEFRNRNVSIG